MSTLYEGRGNVDGSDPIIPASPTGLSYIVLYQMVHENTMRNLHKDDVFYRCGMRRKCSTSFIGTVVLLKAIDLPVKSFFSILICPM
jgi:hypothetical protein